MRLDVAVVLVVLGGCGGVAEDTVTVPGGTPTAERHAAGEPPGDPEAMKQYVPAELLEAVRADLAGRVGADVAPRLVSTDAVTWPDGSLGCPEPGKLYRQVLTPGYRVVFEADGETWDYRLTKSGRFKLCELGGVVPEARDDPSI